MLPISSKWISQRIAVWVSGVLETKRTYLYVALCLAPCLHLYHSHFIIYFINRTRWNYIFVVVFIYTSIEKTQMVVTSKSRGLSPHSYETKIFIGEIVFGDSSTRNTPVTSYFLDCHTRLAGFEPATIHYVTGLASDPDTRFPNAGYFMKCSAAELQSNLY